MERWSPQSGLIAIPVGACPGSVGGEWRIHQATSAQRSREDPGPCEAATAMSFTLALLAAAAVRTPRGALVHHASLAGEFQLAGSGGDGVLARIVELALRGGAARSECRVLETSAGGKCEPEHLA